MLFPANQLASTEEIKLDNNEHKICYIKYRTQKTRLKTQETLNYTNQHNCSAYYYAWYRKMDQIDSVILCRLSWPSRYLVQ